MFLSSCETNQEGFQQGYQGATSTMSPQEKARLDGLTRNGRTLPSYTEVNNAIDPNAECDTCSHQRSMLFDNGRSPSSTGGVNPKLAAVLRRQIHQDCRRTDGIGGITCRGSRPRVGRCYLYVKDALHEAGMVPDHAELHAKDAGKHLKRAGMRNILTKIPSHGNERLNAPVGAVLVYAGGPSGHIEVKVSDNEYLSDHNTYPPSRSARLFETNSRQLIGVYVK